MKRFNDRSPAETEKRSKNSSWAVNLEKVLKAEKKEIKSSGRKNEESFQDTRTSKNREELKADREFHLEQTKKRTEIRIQQGRATSFDKLLVISQMLAGEAEVPKVLTEELKKPYKILESLSITELETIKNSIELHLKLEKKTEIQKFWENLLTISEQLLSSSNSPLKPDIEALLSPKTSSQLKDLKLEIMQKKSHKGQESDSGFWDEVLAMIELYQARHVLERICKTLQNDLTLIQTNNLQIKTLFSSPVINQVNFGDGRLSPKMIDFNDFQLSEFELVDEEEDLLQRDSSKKKIFQLELEKFKKTQKKKKSSDGIFLSQEKINFDENNLDQEGVEEMMRFELEKKVESDEVEFQETVKMKPVLEEWMKKFKPRKPKFFNRIKTGYDWNRYNLSHFDNTNPPPKIVQGYKFNIFYPYLIDKTKAPQFYLEPEENTETCIIRFHAGPPYEDIAFRIVNREWDFSDRNGFKCFFDKGILHLYFCFKRYRYKR